MSLLGTMSVQPYSQKGCYLFLFLGTPFDHQQLLALSLAHIVVPPCYLGIQLPTVLGTTTFPSLFTAAKFVSTLLNTAFQRAWQVTRSDGLASSGSVLCWNRDCSSFTQYPSTLHFSGYYQSYSAFLWPFCWPVTIFLILCTEEFFATT